MKVKEFIQLLKEIKCPIDLGVILNASITKGWNLNISCKLTDIVIEPNYNTIYISNAFDIKDGKIITVFDLYNELSRIEYDEYDVAIEIYTKNEQGINNQILLDIPNEINYSYNEFLILSFDYNKSVLDYIPSIDYTLRKGDIVSPKDIPSTLYIVHDTHYIKDHGMILIAPLKEYANDEEEFNNSIRFPVDKLLLNIQIKPRV